MIGNKIHGPKMKRLVLQIDCCDNCLFCDKSKKKAECFYAVALVDGQPIKIKSTEGTPDWCPLCDAEEKDCVPARFRYVSGQNGPTIFIDD